MSSAAPMPMAPGAPGSRSTVTATTVVWQQCALRDATRMPWRNGGGVTHEFVAWPSPDAWQWRVSVAEIASDGPFSRFEGVRRCFAVLRGVGVVLTLDGRDHVLRTDSAPLSFGGEQACHARLLDGPTLDFNLMVRGQAHLQWLGGETGRIAVQAGCWFGFFASQPLQVTDGSSTLDLAADTLAWRWINAEAPLLWQGRAALCWSAQPA